jgi:hypothetical protein
VLVVCTYVQYDFAAFSGWALKCLLSISQYGYGIVILYEVPVQENSSSIGTKPRLNE